jgi:hypothetical protein
MVVESSTQSQYDIDEELWVYGDKPTPGAVTVSVGIDPAGRGRYADESGNRVVVTPIYSPYPLDE